MSKFSRKIKLNKIKQQELLKTLLQNNIMSLMHYLVVVENLWEGESI